MKKIRTRYAPALLFVVLGTGVALGACSRENRALGESPRGDVARALQSLADARCDRAVRCNQIGAGQRWSSRDACIQSVRQAERKDINLYECTGGVDQKELSECLNEINTANCESAFDALAQMAACRSSDMCLH
ncbi:DUF6184 family natural product biosynthesis lipoprotein [Polyangium mundeleinium]|uniref:DUF6184 family natural product biosynthesis lipoprotein n=1 Tax=Polyangium mundeleinium TaxID=2995306 RepID=A0ABT5ED34_9BACT|nr:DUF6184 family natural product biosynthesis lipoprotein [Polyangium mundeleinium]MDC0739730.1 DUF6184 family natural product biosynthesis lipoprotein [Polyangium mundeleinium]